MTCSLHLVDGCWTLVKLPGVQSGVDRSQPDRARYRTVVHPTGNRL